MASISLKTFKGGNVTPQDDAIIYQTALPGAGIFRGCEVSFARSNVLHISSGFGMIKGRFFEMYENEIPVQMADTGMTLNGRIYIHMDLSNADEPVQILTETAATLSTLAADANVNYNNTTYDLELAQFKVTSSEIKELTNVYKTITGGGSGGGGSVGLERETAYSVGDTISCTSAPGWCTLYCSQGGLTATAEPKGYAQITKVGDTVLDGTCIFVARNTLAELTQAQEDLTSLSTKHNTDVAALTKKISDTADEVAKQMSSTGNLVQKIMSITDYQKLGTYDKNTMYYCYDNSDTQEIKFIYLGQHVIYATGINVTYQIDTNNAITQVAALSNDAVKAAPTVSKAGYTFVGWKSDTNADGSVLKSYILNSANAVKLYAVFKKTITIDMDSMDADVPDGAEEPSVDVDLYYNNGTVKSDEVTMPECPYTMEGKSFCGWTIDPQKPESHMPGVKYTFTKSETLLPCFVETEMDFTNVFTNYTNYRVPADGIYEFECWGGQGGDASGNIDGEEMSAKGGKGGHVKVYKKLKKGTLLYVYVGSKPEGTRTNYNYGGAGYTYTNSKHIGAAGGGATYISDYSISICNLSDPSRNFSQNKSYILLIAGGGGGAGISASTYENASTNPKNCYIKGPHNGGYGGGEKGEDGSSGSRGGHQTSESYYEYTGWGYITNSSSSLTISGGGSGWYAGDYGQYGNSGAGGSSYVGNNPTFTYNGVKYKTVNEANKNEGHGRAHIKFILPCVVD